ncbi:hypothetical protein K435DRAFT_894040 [Dendrothele bispora CBS 962.96]|uniref:Uncharacterized protein n=1 Tax=Dendrothele bispora (strain CBS 962.96) TaxID=1314807 RepID=A0A4S8KNG9_DENBC|nr:hypothetical protein K435DRAFT_894040 [Dendrothele bispora CBS 962.96]
MKQLAPTPYDGSPDIQKFENFVMEASAWVKACNLPKSQQCFVVSRRLTSTAKSFFMHKVAGNHHKWKLTRFFRELFNFCFPLDYRDQQRLKLRRCLQRER